MLHTSGLCYEFFSHDGLKYRTAKNIPAVVACNFESIRTVLLHDPGAAWTYGVNIDWLGRIVEQQRGKRLGEMMKERSFGTLGMNDIGLRMSDSMKARRVTIHDRAADGKPAGCSRPPPSRRWSRLPGLRVVPGFVEFESAVYHHR